jgi:hypothetical protein
MIVILYKLEEEVKNDNTTMSKTARSGNQIRFWNRCYHRCLTIHPEFATTVGLGGFNS